jgi:DNA-binding response OmpR family regulator
MLPGLDGLSVLRRLRESRGETPVLILTVKNEVGDRVAGLRAGADDYLSKPFALDELLARVEALVRRRYGNKRPLIRVGELELDTALCQFRHLGSELELTPREYRVLELLIRREGAVVSRAEIEEHIYGDDVEIFSNAVESVVSTLRRKLEQAGAAPLIQTRRGLGYLLRADNE